MGSPGLLDVARPGGEPGLTSRAQAAIKKLSYQRGFWGGASIHPRFGRTPEQVNNTRPSPLRCRRRSLFPKLPPSATRPGGHRGAETRRTRTWQIQQHLPRRPRAPDTHPSTPWPRQTSSPAPCPAHSLARLQLHVRGFLSVPGLRNIDFLPPCNISLG